MKLHDKPELFRQAIQFAAQELGIPEIFVEKDYWVTFALYTIFKSDVGSEAVFKGGTSLLKCYSIIKRFSEDIDLVVLRREKESNNKLTSKIRSISDVVSKVLPEVSLQNITVKMGMNRKTAHTYPKLFSGDFGQVRDKIIVEATWLGYFEPYNELRISSFIYDMMIKNGQTGIAEENNLSPFTAKVLDPKRTICEKIMSLVRFSYGVNSLEDLRAKIRHTYDLYQLLQQKVYKDFFLSNEFEEMLLKVGQDDVESYKSNNKWLKFHPTEAMIFKNLETVWKQLQNTYVYEFRAMVFGDDFPDAPQILNTLQEIKSRLALIKWEIDIK